MFNFFQLRCSKKKDIKKNLLQLAKNLLQIGCRQNENWSFNK